MIPADLSLLGPPEDRAFDRWLSDAVLPQRCYLCVECRERFQADELRSHWEDNHREPDPDWQNDCEEGR